MLRHQQFNACRHTVRGFVDAVSRGTVGLAGVTAATHGPQFNAGPRQAGEVPIVLFITHQVEVHVGEEDHRHAVNVQLEYLSVDAIVQV